MHVGARGSSARGKLLSSGGRFHETTTVDLVLAVLGVREKNEKSQKLARVTEVASRACSGCDAWPMTKLNLISSLSRDDSRCLFFLKWKMDREIPSLSQ